jgi:tetratricopeptide (TPR) repeat protein
MTARCLSLFCLFALLVSGGCIRQKRGDVFDGVVENFNTISSPYAKHDSKLTDQQRFDKALQKFLTERYMKVQRLFAKVESQYPSSPLAPASVYYQGECFRKKGICLQALRYYEKLNNRWPSSEYALLAKLKQAVCFQRTGRSNLANSLFRKIQADYPQTKYAAAARAGLEGRLTPAESLAPGTTGSTEVAAKTPAWAVATDAASPASPLPAGAACSAAYPNRYLIIIANGSYKHYSPLSYTTNDAATLQRLGACYMGVPEQNIRIHRDVTYAELKRILENLPRDVNQHDAVVFLYYTGHGAEDARGTPYIIPVDAQLLSPQDLQNSAVSLRFVRENLKKVQADRKVVLWDACRLQTPWKPVTVHLAESKAPAADQTYVFSSASGQASNISRDQRLSAFVNSLWELAAAGASNLDADGDGYVEIEEMEAPLSLRLRRISPDASQSLEIHGRKDTPFFPAR